MFSPLVHGLYVVSPPTNTLFADDFNEYTTGTDLGNGYGTGVNGCPTTGGTVNQCFGKVGGWGWYDNAAGGYRHISNNASYSGPLSIEMASATSSPGTKFDMHHMIPITNTTTTISLSAYFAFDNFTRNGAGGNNEFTFSLEYWTYTLHRECIVAIFPSAAVVQIVSTDTVSLVTLRLAAIDDTRMISGTAHWHHISMTCNLQDFTYRSVIVDNWDILKQIGFNGFPHWDSSADTSFLVGSAPFTIPLRFEMALLNNPTSAFHIWHKWADDIVVTDTSPGGPPVIQFGITLLSAWFPILVTAVAMLYSTSGIGLIRRVWFNHPQGILSSYRTIVVTGLIATFGFVMLLVLGALVTQQVCTSIQGHATCSY